MKLRSQSYGLPRKDEVFVVGTWRDQYQISILCCSDGRIDGAVVLGNIDDGSCADGDINLIAAGQLAVVGAELKGIAAYF